MDSIRANDNKALDEIDEISSKMESCVEQLLEYCKNKNEEVRLRSLEALRDIRIQKVEVQIREALSDQDELVRTTSLEVLGAWKDRDSVPLIVERLSDESWLVRSEAALALAEIGIIDAIEAIEDRLNLADNEEEKVRYFFALYKLGKVEYWSLFLNGFFHDFYRIRCATANLLPDLVTSPNKDFIMNLLLAVLRNEKTKAAESSIKNAIDEIKQMNVT